MKSKFSLILFVVILLVVGGLVYFFVIKPDNTSTESGLVSTNTGSSQGLQNQNATTSDVSATGSTVVQILRNLSSIQLDDSVFRNPVFSYLVDMTLVLPPATNQGRRNPFAPIGSEGGVVVPITGSITTPSTGFAPTSGTGAQ